ncbi:MAG: TIGR00730 family Rossman fold protein [Myxococcales bacterium]|nr:TIGR00730 family Rossman fold protein [Myxococcales bacterium]
MHPTRRVTVFCGSAHGVGDTYVAAAAQLGRWLAAQGYGLVYGGASIGTMGALADAALAGGAEVIGIMPRAIVDRELAHAGLTRLEIVVTMAERKARMMELADAFVVLPGGFGTLDEAFEVLCAAQLGAHAKPLVFCNIAGFWSPLRAWLDTARDAGMVAPPHHAQAIFVDEIAELAQLLRR